MKNSNISKEHNIKTEKLPALISLFKIIYKYSQKFENIKDIFDKLENENKHIILMDLLKSFRDDKSLKDIIFNFYIHNINIYYKKIIELFENLDEENIKIFMSKISNKKDDKKNYKIISYENFFTEKESLNLNLLQELNKNIDLIKKTYYFGESRKVLQKIYDAIEYKKLEIRHLKSLLSFPKDNALKRFELLNILYRRWIRPEDEYEELKAKYDKAQKEVNELRANSEGLKVFYKNFHKDEIKKIEEKIDKFNNGTIKEFDNISKLSMELGEDLKKKAVKINKIKQSTIFRKLFEKTQGNDEDIRFETALKNLKSEFNTQKRKAKNKDDKIMKESPIIIDILGLKDDEETQKELKFLENFSVVEEDTKSMIYFCENFKLNGNDNIDENEKNKDLNNKKVNDNQNELKKKIEELNNEILDLNNKLEKEKNLNNKLTEKIKNLENIIEKEKEKNSIKNDININENYNKDKIIELFEEIRLKDKEIRALQEQKSRFPFDLLEGEKIMSIIINSEDENIQYSIICKSKDIFNKIEDIFYEKYAEYRSTKETNFLTLNGKKIDRYKTLEENKIENHSIIILYKTDN